ncbi:MAG TPA: hypothetical protein PLZ84_00470 [Clostridia bacterium]|nr:hypothetical protein [Clostridia bacterium]
MLKLRNFNKQKASSPPNPPEKTTQKKEKPAPEPQRIWAYKMFLDKHRRLKKSLNAPDDEN